MKCGWGTWVKGRVGHGDEGTGVLCWGTQGGQAPASVVSPALGGGRDPGHPSNLGTAALAATQALSDLRSYILQLKVLRFQHV